MALMVKRVLLATPTQLPAHQPDQHGEQQEGQGQPEVEQQREQQQQPELDRLAEDHRQPGIQGVVDGFLGIVCGL